MVWGIGAKKQAQKKAKKEKQEKTKQRPMNPDLGDMPTKKVKYIPKYHFIFSTAKFGYLNKMGEYLDPTNSNVKWLLSNGLIKEAESVPQ